MSTITTQTPEIAIRSCIERWLSACHAKDLPAILAYYADDVRAFDAIGQLQFVGREAYARHWAMCLEMCPGGMHMQLQDLQVQASERIGFAYGLMKCSGEDDKGQEQVGWMRMTTCFECRNGEWLVVHEHFSSPFDPMSNQVLQGLQP